jgi:hypothetical protein
MNPFELTQVVRNWRLFSMAPPLWTNHDYVPPHERLEEVVVVKSRPPAMSCWPHKKIPFPMYWIDIKLLLNQVTEWMCQAANSCELELKATNKWARCLRTCMGWTTAVELHHHLWSSPLRKLKKKVVDIWSSWIQWRIRARIDNEIIKMCKVQQAAHTKR